MLIMGIILNLDVRIANRAKYTVVENRCTSTILIVTILVGLSF